MINTLLGTFLFMLIARILTKEEMGIYSALYLTVSIGFMIALLGLDQAMVRYLAYFEGRNKHYEATFSVKRILYLSILTSVIITTIYYFIAPILSQIMFKEVKYTLLIQLTALTIIPTVFGTIALSFIQGLQKFYQLAIARLLAQTTRFIGTIILLLVGFSVLAVIYGWAIFYITSSLFALPIFIKWFFKNKSNPVTSIEEQGKALPYNELFVFSLPIMGTYFLSYILNAIDQYVVLGMIGIKSLGGYFIATTASTLIPTVLGIPLLTTLVPSMSETYGKLNAQGLSSNISLAGRYIALFFIPATLLLASLSPIALWILAGQAYLSVSIPLTIICIGLATYGFSILISSALTAIAQTKIILIVLALASAIELIASIILTPLYGLNGAAISRAIMYILMFLLFLYIGKRYLTIKLDKPFIIKATLSSIIMFIATFIVAFITYFNIIFLPLHLLIALVAYTLSLASMGALTMNDVRLILKILPMSNKINYYAQRIVNSSTILQIIIKKLIKE
jgi:O-antigen/teichoic acid export membrane protein